MCMSHSSPTAILLNIGHAMDHWLIVVFAYTWGVIAGVWGVEWTELTPFNYGALFMFGMGSIVSGRLGDLWGRWIMMVIFFAGIGVNGLAGNMGIAIAAGVSVYIAQRFGWQMAFVIPGVICLVCAVAFVALVPREEEAPAKRKQKMIDLPPAVMARVFAIMTFTAVTGSIIFNFTTNGNGELLRERVKGAVQDPAEIAMMLFVIFSLASLAQLVVGKLIDRFPLKNIYVPIVLLQVPLFLIASQVTDWALFVTAIGFMLLVFGAIPFTDAMIVKYIDDRMRSRVTGADRK